MPVHLAPFTHGSREIARVRAESTTILPKPRGPIFLVIASQRQHPMFD
uniref:Uncharacterized protein n=1 Tax=Rhizophora mucronata TaxID=61149 RepID=A0A2P2JJS7_RHIMU